MDDIVCANTAFRYWRCPPQVRDIYPRLPSSDDGWRALSQAPFVTDVLKTPIIAVASPGCCNHHSGLRSTIRWEGASDTGTTTDTHLGFSVTNPLNTLFTMTRFVSQIDLVLAMYELCGFAISLISYLCQSSALGIWLLRMGRFALIYSPSFAPISSSTAAEVGALA